VFASSSGHRLLDDDGLEMLAAELLPKAMLVTPNVPEAEVLAGIKIESDADVREAARRIRDLGPAAVVITGGHRSGSEAIDVLYDGRDFSEFRVPRIAGRTVHGSGCAFSAAIAASIASGMDLPNAIAAAQKYVAERIAHSLSPGKGQELLIHFRTSDR
jgi:hydroxymethylpyrimidine/phosphomethylpyrimidine kinase